ncbi:MAG: hypothetical protein M1823_008986, partial [Watsoniomyces obsoletus]
MPLRDLLRKKDRIEKDGTPVEQSSLPQASEFTFMRTDTNTQELINPPSLGQDGDEKPGETSPKKHFFRKGPKVSP